MAGYRNQHASRGEGHQAVHLTCMVLIHHRLEGLRWQQYLSQSFAGRKIKSGFF